MKITVRTFQAINEIKNSGLDELDKSFEIVRAITGMSMEQIKKMRIRKFNKIIRAIGNKFSEWGSGMLPVKGSRYIKVNNKPYRIHDDIYQMNAARYVEVITFAKDSVGNMHKLLASMVVPQQWTILGMTDLPYKDEDHQYLSDQMLDADYGDIYSALVSMMNSISKITEEFGYLWQGEQGESTGAVAAAFSKIWGWVYQTKLVAEFEGISMEQAWALPVRQYLNDLCYIKMKREVDEEYMRKMELKRR